MLKIWGRTNSINVQKVLWACAELGVKYDRVDAGMQYGVVGTEEYKALNPNSRVPTIEDDGFVLWESNTVVRYLAAKHGAGSLMPASFNTRFDAERWMDWCTTTLQPTVTPIFWNLIRTPPEKRDMKAVEEAKVQAAAAFAILDRYLAGKAFITGSALNMGDIPIGCFTYRWMALPIERPRLPNLEAWYSRLQSRAGYKQHIMQPLS